MNDTQNIILFKKKKKEKKSKPTTIYIVELHFCGMLRKVKATGKKGSLVFT